MTPTTPILEMEAMTKAFPSPAGDVFILRNINLRILPGEFLAITGPSGAGKTTLLNLAALLDCPSAGRVRFNGTDTDHCSETDRNAIRARDVGMVFQNFCLLSRRTVMQNVLFRFRYMDTPISRAVPLAEKALHRVGMLERANQPVRLLSGGEMQRVAIARAIAVSPRLLLVDEPTGNLDRDAAARILETFTRLNQEGMSMILVTHNLELIVNCTRHLQCDGQTLKAAD